MGLNSFGLPLGALLVTCLAIWLVLRQRRLSELRKVSPRRESSGRLLEAERAARTEVERSARLKDEFLATLSHELRTPLNAILGWAHILRTAGLDAEETRQGLETIERNAKALATIVEDLLDMSKITQGKFHLDIKDLDLTQIVQAAVQAVQPSCNQKNVTIQSSLPATLPARGDAVRLQQVVWNLLSNAIKFSNSGGQVEVKLAALEDSLELTVRDFGTGIEPSFLPHLFDKFRQQDGSSTRGAKSMGLGLTIVKQILEVHGGSVQAVSQGKGQGSVFTVRLPKSRGLGEEAREEQRIEFHRARIVVVEDDADTREFLVRLLRDRGAEVASASSAEKALTLLEEQKTELLISDIGMAGKDGYQLIREVRAHPQLGALPAIAVTAFAREEDREAALRAGFQQHFCKPIQADRLLKAARKLVGGNQSSSSSESI